MQQILLQRNVQQQKQHLQEQQHPQQQRCQQKQQQRNENTDFTTSAHNNTAATDPPIQQNAAVASALAAKMHEDRMKVTVQTQRDVSDEASMKQRLTESIGPLLESNPTSVLKSPARPALSSGQFFHRSAGGMSGSLPQPQTRSEPLRGSVQLISGYEGRNKCSFESESSRYRWVTIWSTRPLFKIAALQQQKQQQSSSHQQLLQHPLLNQQQQNSNYHASEQEKMGAGAVTVAFHGHEPVCKNQNGRKRKHPISFSGPANSSGTTNTAGASPSSTPSTPSAHSPGETISTPLLPHNANLSTALVVYDSDALMPIESQPPTNPRVDMDHFVEDGSMSMEDNVEPFLSHDDTDPRAVGSHCITSSKGYILREMSSAQASTSSVLCCHFSSDGKLLATGGHDKKACGVVLSKLFSGVDIVMELYQGYSIRTFTGHSAYVMSLDFHPNKDDLICSCDGDNEIRFWSIKHGNIVRIFKGGSTQLRFQPRYGGYLATASDNIVSILDVETQSCVRRFEQSHTKDVDTLCWDPTGEYVVSVSEDAVKSLELWDMAENRSMTIAAHDSLISAVASSSSGLVASTSHDKYVKLWR
nr:unnamed protein product [Digitaria exilis]